MEAKHVSRAGDDGTRSVTYHFAADELEDVKEVAFKPHPNENRIAREWNADLESNQHLVIYKIKIKTIISS